MQLRCDIGINEYHRLSATRPTWLLLTGGDTVRCGVSEAKYMGTIAEARGVPTERLLFEDLARYTIENALFVRRMLLECEGPPVREVAVVTNAFHMPRSALIFRTVLEPACTVRLVEASDGTRLLEDTGKALPEWLAAEQLQLELLRSECGSDFGNLLSQRIRAHDNLALAAKTGNLGAMRAWWELKGKSSEAGGVDSQVKAFAQPLVPSEAAAPPPTWAFAQPRLPPPTCLRSCTLDHAWPRATAGAPPRRRPAALCRAARSPRGGRVASSPRCRPQPQERQRCA